MPKIFPVVAIVGQPNVGKSTLLNKIVGTPLAVTSDIAGTTRDRQYADVSWNNVNFTLLDTAGLSFSATSELENNVAKQIEVAMQEANLLLLVVDGKQPARALPQQLLKKFRRAGKKAVLVVNKLDSPKSLEEKVGEFQALGIKPSFGLSSLTGRGVGDLLDFLSSVLKKLQLEPDEAANQAALEICVCIVGKPNVGKSTIFNKILKQERAVVSAVPGTTRTAIDSRLNIAGVDYTFIDTAGLKKKEYRQAQPDLYSGFQTFKAIRRSDVCLFAIDASEELTKQDQRVAAEIFDQDKGCIILANKVDLLQPPLLPRRERAGVRMKKNDGDYPSLRDSISLHFPFLWMCPLFFVSGGTGEGLPEALNAIKPIFDRRQKTIDNQTLAEFLSKKLKQNPPKLLRDQKKPKVFSLHQFDVSPPKFELLVNHSAAISMQFRKFVENSIIRDLDFYGTPIILKLIGKDKT